MTKKRKTPLFIPILLVIIFLLAILFLEKYFKNSKFSVKPTPLNNINHVLGKIEPIFLEVYKVSFVTQNGLRLFEQVTTSSAEDKSSNIYKVFRGRLDSRLFDVGDNLLYLSRDKLYNYKKSTKTLAEIKYPPEVAKYISEEFPDIGLLKLSDTTFEVNVFAYSDYETKSFTFDIDNFDFTNLSVNKTYKTTNFATTYLAKVEKNTKFITISSTKKKLDEVKSVLPYDNKNHDIYFYYIQAQDADGNNFVLFSSSTLDKLKNIETNSRRENNYTFEKNDAPVLKNGSVYFTAGIRTPGGERVVRKRRFRLDLETLEVIQLDED